MDNISKRILSMSADELNTEFGIVKMNGTIMYNDKVYEYFKSEVMKNSVGSSRTGLELREAISDTLNMLVDAGRLSVNSLSC